MPTEHTVTHPAIATPATPRSTLWERLPAALLFALLLPFLPLIALLALLEALTSGRLHEPGDGA